MNNELATEKQINYMKGLGIEHFAGMTKALAKELISNKLAESESNTPTAPVKAQFEAPKKEFHLSPEQVRTNALNAAIEIASGRGSPRREILEIAKDFVCLACRKFSDSKVKDYKYSFKKNKVNCKKCLNVLRTIKVHNR